MITISRIYEGTYKQSLEKEGLKKAKKEVDRIFDDYFVIGDKGELDRNLRDFQTGEIESFLNHRGII